MIHITWYTYIVVLLATIIFAYYLRTQILRYTKVDGPLTKNEMIGVASSLLINVLMIGSIYYFSLYKKYPKKAKDVNKYITIIFIAIVIIQYGLHIPLFVLTK